MVGERGREELWTLDELSARVALALSVDYDGQPSGRVREVPDGRVVRYYTTLGLVDRPVGYDGRIALYTARHLRQILGIKRLQQEGASLAQIQQVFLGLDEAGLERLAAAPPEALSPAMPRAPAAPRAQTPDAKRGEAAAHGAGESVAPESEKEAQHTGKSRERFWNAAPAEAVTDAAVSTKKRASRPAPPAAGSSKPQTLRGVTLSDAALLLAGFSRELDESDVEALREAAAPLLDVLQRRGLV